MIRILTKSDRNLKRVRHASTLRVGGFNRFAHSAGTGTEGSWAWAPRGAGLDTIGPWGNWPAGVTGLLACSCLQLNVWPFCAGPRLHWQLLGFRAAGRHPPLVCVSAAMARRTCGGGQAPLLNLFQLFFGFYGISLISFGFPGFSLIFLIFWMFWFSEIF